MPRDDAPPIEVAFTPTFKRNVRRLERKYRNIRSDLTPLIEQLQQAQTPGEQIQHTGYTVFKVRIRNSDARRSKSGGYRMIYYLKTQEKIILLTIYSKSDQEDIAADSIRSIISEYKP